MKKNCVNVCMLFSLVLALTACPTGDGGGSGGPYTPPPPQTPLEYTLTSDNLVIKITETNTEPRAAITPVSGNYYWVYLDGVLINKGTITVSGNGTTIRFRGSGSFTLTLEGDNYALASRDRIPNALPGGNPISGPRTFTGGSGGGGGDLSMTIRNVRTDGVTITHVEIEDYVSNGNPERLYLADEDVSIAPGEEKKYTNPGFRFEDGYDSYYGPGCSYTVHIETSPDIDSLDGHAMAALKKRDFPVIYELRDNGLIRVGGSHDN
jgi:hypothetical protein